MKFLALISILFFSFAVHAHSGRTDASGCHTNHSTGDYHCHNPKNKERSTSSEDKEDLVAFNTKTKKIHRVNCKSAKACTVNCVTLPKKEALKRGGTACGNCGG